MPVEHTLTDMLRNSGPVLAEAQAQDVLLRRRDGADVMLVDAHRHEGFRESLRTVTAFLLTALEHPVMRDLAVEIVPRAMPWTRFLSADDQAEFLQEVAAIGEASAELESYDALAMVIESWRNTARLYAIPALFDAATSAIDGAPETEVIERP